MAARREQLKQNAEECMKTFTRIYLRNYRKAVFDAVRKELQNQNSPYNWKLERRRLNEIERDEMFSGTAYIKVGEGPGDWKDWKKLFVVERQDFGIDIFESEKAFSNKKKPLYSVQTAGYKVITEVRDKFKQFMEPIAHGLRMSEDEVDAFVADLSEQSWALYHPFRPKFVFQLTEPHSPNKGCCGFGKKATVSPEEDLPEELQAERQTFVDTLRSLSDMACPRDRKAVTGIAFENTVLDFKAREEKLANFSSDGNEHEILTDLLFEYCIPDFRESFLNDLKGPTVIRIKAWYKSLKLLHKTIGLVVNAGWTAIQKMINEIRAKLHPILKGGIVKILEFKMKVQDKIKDLSEGKFDTLLNENVLPFVDPMIKAFANPLDESFKIGRSLLAENIDMSQLSEDASVRRRHLSNVIHTKENRMRINGALRAVREPLENLKTANPVNERVFEGLDVDILTAQANLYVLLTLDSAIFTLSKKLEDSEVDRVELLEEVLKDYDHDVIVAKCKFSKKVAKAILITAFRKICSAVLDPLLAKIDDAIPDEIENFLDIERIVHDFIKFIVTQPIERIVEKAYPISE